MSQLAAPMVNPANVGEELGFCCVGLKSWGFKRMAGRSCMNREVHVRMYVQLRLVCSAGVSPVRVTSRSPVAWMAGMRETDYLKPIDKTILKGCERGTGP
jgi:hypothetical protein